MKHALDSCPLEHPDHSPEYDAAYQVCHKIDAAISQVPLETRDEYKTQMEDFKKKYSEYVGHIIRTKHQGDYYR